MKPSPVQLSWIKRIFIAVSVGSSLFLPAVRADCTFQIPIVHAGCSSPEDQARLFEILLESWHNNDDSNAARRNDQNGNRPGGGLRGGANGVSPSVAAANRIDGNGFKPCQGSCSEGDKDGRLYCVLSFCEKIVDVTGDSVTSFVGRQQALQHRAWSARLSRILNRLKWDTCAPKHSINIRCDEY